MGALTQTKRLVVKIGSALLVDADTGRLRADWLRSLCADVADLRKRGVDVLLVSSGSIALGRGVLGLPRGELSLEQSQAAAAAGQISLARAYQEELEPSGIVAAQVLTTLEDSADRRRYLNSRATLRTLLQLGAVPIVNENDTVATDEIRYGDNDRLAAQIGATVGADRVVLLSDVDGLYTANPSTDPEARHIPTVDALTPEILAMAGDPVSGLSKGGMKTKLLAARIATEAGATLGIASGSGLHPLTALDDGGRVTWFSAQITPQAARKRWIASMKPQGVSKVDDGALQALWGGKSLLHAGVTRIDGDFRRGDPLQIEAADGTYLGMGLSAYSSDEAKCIAGHRSGDIAGILGYHGRPELIHRDDMVLSDRGAP